MPSPKSGLPDTPKNGYATKAQVLLWIGSVIAVLTTVGLALLDNHNNQPHKGAVLVEQFSMDRATQIEWREEQRNINYEIKTLLVESRTNQQATNNLLMRLINEAPVILD